MDPLNPAPPALVMGAVHLHGGQAWSYRLPRHTTLRITALGDGANVALHAWHAHQPAERWNLPDTLKEQYCAYLTSPRVLMTDMGHVLLSMTSDTCGWHDCLNGVSGPADTASRYGIKTYQEHRNARIRNGRDNILTEMLKHDLTLRDFGSTLNLFSKVIPDAEGKLRFISNHCRRGHYVDLRAELDTLVVLTAIQHPLDPHPSYAPVPVYLSILRTPPPGPDDRCRLSRPETIRAFARTEGQFT